LAHHLLHAAAGELMTKHVRSKLSLSRETLVALQTTELDQVNGGVRITPVTGALCDKAKSWIQACSPTDQKQ
jgi:hypothetical protein